MSIIAEQENPDTAAIEGEKMIAHGRAKCASLDDGDHESSELIGRYITEVHDVALGRPVTTLTGAACLLRLLADPVIGIAAGQGINDELAIRHVLAVVEREAAKGGAS